MRDSINRTLKEKLVLNPKPKCNRNEFFLLNDRILINREAVIEFLDLTESQKKTEIAKKLIDCMVLDSNFPPVSALLDNIYQFEMAIRYDRSVENVSRDHYIHMCYLYLLGIYLFFYYPDCNIKLSASLSLLKTADGNNEKSNFVKSFLSAWKYFVLYHDIAYPFEYFGNNEHSYNEAELLEKEKLGRLFTSEAICNGIIDMITVKGMALLLAVRYGVEKAAKKPNIICFIKKKKADFIDEKGKELSEEILDEMKEKDLYHLQYIASGEDLKCFLTVFTENDFLVVFRKELQVECFFYKETLYRFRDAKKKKYMCMIERNKKIVFDDEINTKLSGLTVEYYGLSLREKSDKLFEKINFLPSLLDNYNFSGRHIRKMRDIIQWYYLDCQEEIRKSISENDSLERFKLNVQQQITDSLKAIKVKDVDDNMYLGETRLKYIQTYVKAYIKQAKNVIAEKERSAESIANRANTDAQELNNKNETVKSLFRAIKKEMQVEIPAPSAKAGLINEIYDASNCEAVMSLLNDDAIQYVTDMMRRAVESSSTLKDMIEEYDVGYSQYDHGIVASYVFALHFSFYQKVIAEVVNNKWRYLGFNIPVLLDADEQEELIKRKYTTDYLGITEQIVYAILIHNLYPDKFKRKKMQTDEMETPFAYFCMMCDALQNWGRPMNVNPLVEKIHWFLDSEKYNIALDEYINITFEENRTEIIEKRLKPFREEMGKYLVAFEEKIRLNFV